MKNEKPLNRSEARTGGSKRRKDFHKKIGPWCKKHLKSGHPWDGHKVYMPHDTPDFLKEKKPLTCDVCKKRVSEIRGEWHINKVVNRCEDCIHNGLWEILKGGDSK